MTEDQLNLLWAVLSYIFVIFCLGYYPWWFWNHDWRQPKYLQHRIFYPIFWLVTVFCFVVLTMWFYLAIDGYIKTGKLPHPEPSPSRRQKKARPSKPKWHGPVTQAAPQLGSSYSVS